MSVISKFAGWFSSLFTSGNEKTTIKINNDNSAKKDSVKSDTPGTRTPASSDSSSPSARSNSSGGGGDFQHPMPPWGMRDFGPPRGPWGF